MLFKGTGISATRLLGTRRKLDSIIRVAKSAWFDDAALSCVFCGSRLLCVCVSLRLAFAQPLADSVRTRWHAPRLASAAFVDGNGEPA